MYMYILSLAGVIAYPAAFFGAGSGSVYLSSLQCTGSEPSLLDCPSSATNNCGHSRDAGVHCEITRM